MARLLYAALSILILSKAFASEISRQEEEQTPERVLGVLQSLTQDDSALAQLLQVEEYDRWLDNAALLSVASYAEPSSSSNRVMPQMPEPVARLYALYDTRRKSLGNAWDMDVHAFNRKMQFATLLPILIAHDSFSKPDLSFAQIKSEMLASVLFKEADATLQKDVKVGLATLERHLQNSAIEQRETNCNVQQLFSRLWSLAIQDQTLLYKFLLILGDNHATGGGCYPGHAGRFADLYLITLRGFWQQ